MNLATVALLMLNLQVVIGTQIKKKHGKWGSESHHKGDIANLFADSSGNSSLKFETDLWCLGCKDEFNNILGKSIIIHQGLDDFHSQPSGNAGKRIGCGRINSVL
jgi:Cu-Zn family superoxide dismutase